MNIYQAADILNVKPDELNSFDIVDTFNNNHLYGYLCRKGDNRYGSLVIYQVNDWECEQVIWATPKLEYPFDRNGVFHWPDVKDILFYEKLDGTNILAYHYMYKDKEFVTFKTRLTPIVQDSGFSTFKSMWIELLDKYKWIERIINDNSDYNLSFELFGSRNPITIKYSNELDTLVLFGINRHTGCVKPVSELVGLGRSMIPTTYGSGDPEMSLTDIYNGFRAEASKWNENDLYTEGFVMYVYVGEPSWRMMKCVGPRTKVFTENGPMTIQHIVSKKIKTKIASFENGKIVYKNIIGWYKTLINGRKCYYVHFKHSCSGGRNTRGLNCTYDHKFLLANGTYKQIEEINENDLIYTGEISPNDKQLSIINGCLLGDGSINGGRFRFSQTDIEYSKIKSNALNDLVQTEFIINRKKYNINCKDTFEVNCKTLIWSKKLYNKWYKDNKKIIPNDLILDDLTMVVWYLDDGHYNKIGKNIILATNGFTLNDIELLCIKLKEYGIKNPKITTQNAIYINVEDTRYLMNRIDNYIPLSMSRKKVNNYFDITLWNTDKPIIGVDTLIKSETTLQKKEKSVYCIDVENTHNFLTYGGFVHNCKPEEIEKIHWSASGHIPKHSLFTTAINVFESYDNPSVDDFIELLKEEYPVNLITKNTLRINNVWKEAIERMKFVKAVNDVYQMALKEGFDINKDKNETMRFMSKHFNKSIMGKVGTVVLKNMK